MSDLTIGWLDPSINSRNTGDQIIADAVEAELRELVPKATLLRIPTQTFLSRMERSIASKCDHFIVGGTNLLNGNIPAYMQWKLDPHTMSIYRGRVSLLGVGWWQYKNHPNFVARRTWSALLGDGVHSVRDDYTAAMLEAVGINSRNTSCPTLWRVPTNIEFSKSQPDSVIFTITDYHKDPVQDARLIAGLRARYTNVVAWAQGAKDREYIKHIARGVSFLGESLVDFDEALNSRGFDYVGTRLHAGVRALQHGAKSTIIAVDNRAPEIARTTGLPVVSRQLDAAAWEAIDSRQPLGLALPTENIASWKNSLVASLS